MSWDGFNNRKYGNNFAADPPPGLPPRPPPHLLPVASPVTSNNHTNTNIPPPLPPKIPLNESSSPAKHIRMGSSSSPQPATDWNKSTRYGGITGQAVSMSRPAASVDGNPGPRNPSMHARRDMFNTSFRDDAQAVEYNTIPIFAPSPPQDEYCYDESSSHSLSHRDLSYDTRLEIEHKNGVVQLMPSRSLPAKPPSVPPPPPPQAGLLRGSPSRSGLPVPPPHDTQSLQTPPSKRYAPSTDQSPTTTATGSPTRQNRQNSVGPSFSGQMTTMPLNRSRTKPNTRPPSLANNEAMQSADYQSTTLQHVQRRPPTGRYQTPRSVSIPDNLSLSMEYPPKEARMKNEPAAPYVQADYFTSAWSPDINSVSVPLSPAGSGLRSGSKSPSRSPARSERMRSGSSSPTKSPVRGDLRSERSSTTHADVSSSFSTTFVSTAYTEPLDRSRDHTPLPKVYSPLNLLSNDVYYMNASEVGLPEEIYALDYSPVPPQHGVPFEDESDDHETGYSDRYSFDNRSYSQSPDAFSYSNSSEPRSPAESGVSSPPKPPLHLTPYGSIRYPEHADADPSRTTGLQKWSSWSSAGGVGTTNRSALNVGTQPVVRANTTGRVPLEADGNLRSQQRQVSHHLLQPQPQQQEEEEEEQQQEQEALDPQPRLQLQNDDHLYELLGYEDSHQDEYSDYPGMPEDELNFSDIPPTEPLQLRPTFNDNAAANIAEESRPQSPTESATSTHADTDAMIRLGLPTELPATSPNLSSQAQSEVIAQQGARQSTTHIKFGKQTLSSLDYKSCEQPWILSELYRWVRRVMAREANVMRENDLVELIRGLFTHWIPTLRSSTADENASAAIASFILQGVMDKPDAIHLRVPQQYEPEYIARLVAFSGVLTELAGRGCFSTLVHSDENNQTAWRCYSPKCSRTLRRLPKAVPEVSQDFLNASDWSAIIPTGVLRGLPKKEIIRQSVIFEIIQGEHKYLEEIRRFLANFRDKPVAKDLWAATEQLLKINTECLYGPLLVRQAANPIMNGIGDIFHEWLLTVQSAYELYASILEDAKRQYKLEAARDPAFEEFDKNYKIQSRDEYGAVWLRLIRYPLLLKRICDETEPPTYERQKLKQVLDKMNRVILAFQARYAEGQQRYALRDLEETIKFPDRRLEVNLHLNAKSRQLIHQGRIEVKVEGHTRHSRYLILLDNYLLIASVSTGPRPTFTIVHHPIPIDLLVLLSNNEAPGSSIFHIRPKSQSNLSGVIDNRSPIPPPADELKEKAQALLNVKEGGDTDKQYPVRIEHLGRKGARYTFYVASENDRREWCKSIESAKRGFAIRMQSFRAEPFALEVISDLAFGYSSEDKAPETPVRSTVGVVERALRDAEFDIGDAAKHPPHALINSRVNCAATFFPDDLGAHTSTNRTMSSYLPTSSRKPYALIGCDWGVYLSDGSSPRSWVPILSLTKVTQIQVLPDFGIAILLANKALVAFDLEALLAANPMEIAHVSPALHPSKRVEEWLMRRETVHQQIALTPHHISRHEFTGFSVGILRGRTIVAGYKKDSSILGSADDAVTKLRIFEPVAGKLRDFGEHDIQLDDDYVRLDRVLLMRKDINGTGRSLATMDITRETDSMVIQKQISGVTVLKNSIVLRSEKGFEAMPLPIRSTVHIPVQDSGYNDFMRKLPNSGKAKPLGIFRIGQQEFLLCYSTYCIFCDKHGQVSRSAYIKFECTARAVAFSEPYIVAFDLNFVEVRSVDSGEKKQIIIGADVRLLRTQIYNDDPDNERSGYVNVTGRTGNDIIFSIAHPEVSGRQLVMKLKLNNDVI
ncbi:CNH domain-containing protein [Lipomyces kononenkoae]|uniref:CNH domain-containing protein n=1 Tax=Lipomyces kononenkoae TaxID=34357 RepID=A0ACC3T6F5_LIPKO